MLDYVRPGVRTLPDVELKSEFAVPPRPTEDNSRRLRKSPEAIRQQLDRLDEVSVAPETVNARRSDRYQYREASLEVEFEQPSGAWVTYALPSRNLSREGVAILFGHYVYPGTRCRVHLLSLQHEVQSVSGRVVRCRYLEGSGMLHEVGVNFETPIDVPRFSRSAAKLRCLLVDDDPSMQRLIGHWVKSLGGELAYARSGKTATSLASSSQFDLVLLDMEMPGMDGCETARELRRLGMACPIVALTALTGEDVSKQALAAGCSSVLNKPITLDALVETIRSTKPEPLVSALCDDSDMKPLVTEFVTSLRDRLVELERSFGSQDYETLGRIARQLKGEGSAYGFEPITDAASEVEQAIEKTLEENELRAQLNELVRLCLSARSERSVEGSTPSPQGKS